MKEIWKDIKDYEGLYQVSNLGRVKSFERIDKLTGISVPEKIRKTSNRDKNSKYQRIGLNKNGKTKRYYVHRLIALTFLDNPNNYSDINHLNEIKTDNRLENLKWCSRKQNINHGTHNKRVSESSVNGSNSVPVVAIYSDDTYEIYPSLSEVGRAIQISSDSVCRACKGEHKNNMSHDIRFEYLSEFNENEHNNI